MLGDVLAGSIRCLAGVCVKSVDSRVFEGVNVYFANHTSHLDAVIIWASLPREVRPRCHPVAARDYWRRGPIRRFCW